MLKRLLPAPEDLCPYCHEVIFEICPNCNGTQKQIPIHKCRNCGKELELDWECCPICRTDIILLPCFSCKGTGKIKIKHDCLQEDLKNKKNRFRDWDKLNDFDVTFEKKDEFPILPPKYDFLDRTFRKEEDKFTFVGTNPKGDNFPFNELPKPRNEDNKSDLNSLNSNKSKHFGMNGCWFVVVSILFLLVTSIVTGFIEVISNYIR